MMRTCYNCDKDPIVTVNQQAFCEEHAQEELERLKEKEERLRNEFENAKEELENAKEKYNVKNYGELEHQLSVEGRDDITEEDVKEFSEIEDTYIMKREKLSAVEIKKERIENNLAV